LSEKVDGNDRFSSCRKTFLHFGRVHREGSFVHVDKHWLRFAIDNGLGCRDECVRNRDYFVAFSNPKRLEREPKRVRAVANADGILRSAVDREFLFKPFHERPACKSAALDYFTNSANELVDHGSVMGL
jgi:hypothetical protein